MCEILWLKWMNGFDQEYTVIIKGVPAEVDLEKVKRAFEALDAVVI